MRNKFKKWNYCNINICKDNEKSKHFIKQIVSGIPYPGGGGVLPYLGMVGKFRGYDPRFGDFQSDWVPILYPTQYNWPTLSTEKIGLSLSHLVQEILGSKVGLIFYQNVLFNRFNAFYINFPLIFDPIDPLFHLF